MYNKKLVVYIPYEVISSLNITNGDDVDFFKYKGRYFIFAKKSDITNLLLKTYNEKNNGLTNEDIEVLKKLDSIRYNQRDSSTIKVKLSDSEISILQRLIRSKIVVPLKNKEGHTLYSISKSIYDKYLLRNKDLANTNYKRNHIIDLSDNNKNNSIKEKPAIESNKTKREIKVDNNTTNITNTIKKPSEGEIIDQSQQFITELQTHGYVVIPTEEEATNISIALEDSIRQGLVVGTRAFNKKFYISLKSFIKNNSEKLLNLITNNSDSVENLSKATGIDEEGVRAILYILAENGDVTELKKDEFKTA